jgi:hypothetical protein
MTDLVGFLTARWDEDEAMARAAIEKSAGVGVYGEQDRTGRWRATTDGIYADTPYSNGPFAVGTYEHLDKEVGAYIAAYDPSRVLADIAAKRRMLAELVPMIETLEEIDELASNAVLPAEYCGAIGRDRSASTRLLRLLAAPYAEHPGFDPAWRTDD